MSWQHRLPVFLVLALGIMLIYAVITREGFQPEFLDQSNVKKTQDMANSSYKQDTNSVRPDGRFAAPPIQGIKSPFRVNVWDAYIP